MSVRVMKKWDPIALKAAESTTDTIPLRIVIAGGGTGGHLFPGIAIADEFVARDPDNSILFVSTGNPLEQSVLPRSGYELAAITSEGIKGRGLIRQCKALLKIPAGILAAIRILLRFKPDLVVGVGSYASGPVAIGAWMLGIKTVLHEQNILPGITNRLLARFAARIFLSFDPVGPHFKPEKTVVSGNPVRKEILALIENTPLKTIGPDSRKRFRILIIGGSQGAHSINLAVMESLAHLKDKHRYHFTHQAGPADEQELRTAYREHGISNRVASFFEHMQFHYADADLVICRAGATTIAEITSLGKAAIFVPFPFAADDHQLKNARSLSDRGAAETIPQQELSGERLAGRISFYADDRAALKQMAVKAGKLGRPDAAGIIVSESYRLLGRSEPKTTKTNKR